jgi:hypothetical protein
VHLYSPRAAHRLIAGGGRDDEPQNEGTNPLSGAVFYYSLVAEPREGADVSLAVFDGQSQDPVWTWTRKPPETDDDEEPAGDAEPPDTRVLTAKPGLNRHSWDLKYPGMLRFDKLILWNDIKTGPMAMPGTYRVRLTVGDTVREQPFEIKPDPRSSASPADYRAQFLFVSECRDLLSRAHREIGRIRELKTRLDELKVRLTEGDPADADLLVEVAAIEEQVTAVEEALYQTSNESEQDPLNFPIRLNDKLAGLMSLVASNDAPPTSQAMAVKTELSAAINNELDALERVWNVRLPALSDSIRATGLDFVTVSGDTE